jgi:hypothetical protein
MAQLHIVRGQSKAITVTLKVGGVAQNTSGYTCELKVRKPGESTLELDLANARFTQTSTTVKTVTLTKAETLALPLGDLEFQFRLVSGADNVLHKIQTMTVYPAIFEA